MGGERERLCTSFLPYMRRSEYSDQCICYVLAELLHNVAGIDGGQKALAGYVDVQSTLVISTLDTTTKFVIMTI